MTRAMKIRTSRSKAMTEKQLQAAVLKLARLSGWLCYHTFDSRRSQPGFPDLVMVRRSRIVFAELKSERGKPTDSQGEWLNAIDATGKVEVYLWRPKHWTDGTIEEQLR